jgi:hypothetical protein
MAFHFLGKEKVPQPFYEILDPQKNIWRGSHQGLMRINPFITLFDYREQNMVDALHYRRRR